MASERSDHHSKSSEKAETLGKVVRDLRDSVGENQSTFADRFFTGRTHITEIENHHLSAEWMRPKLIEDFSAATERIEAAIDKFEPRAKRSRGRSLAELRRDVERLIHDGQNEAARQLLEAFDGARGPADHASAFSSEPPIVEISSQDSYWIAHQLYLFYIMDGDDKRAGHALESAYAAAGSNQDMRNERIECAAKMSRRHLKSADHFAEAHNLLAKVLSEHPDAPQLWLQSGELLWIEQAYAPAYAALTTALTLQADRKEVLRLRAQVLAEWENVEMALDDISEYLAYPSSYKVHRDEVRSAQAYVLTCHTMRRTRDWNRKIAGPSLEADAIHRAEGLFAEALFGSGEEIGIVNYRYGCHCLRATNDKKAARSAFKQAIASAYPLDPVRLRLARQYIRSLT
jgi:hypothetical protein